MTVLPKGSQSVNKSLLMREESHHLGGLPQPSSSAEFDFAGMDAIIADFDRGLDEVEGVIAGLTDLTTHYKRRLAQLDPECSQASNIPLSHVELQAKSVVYALRDQLTRLREQHLKLAMSKA